MSPRKLDQDAAAIVTTLKLAIEFLEQWPATRGDFEAAKLRIDAAQAACRIVLEESPRLAGVTSLPVPPIRRTSTPSSPSAVDARSASGPRSGAGGRSAP